ncbi:hypothetical protein L360_05362 [Enterobacter sp. MGH 14]|nr:hypothetical protein L360_05362 [Enterobacter sp. MGH 14]
MPEKLTVLNVFTNMGSDIAIGPDIIPEINIQRLLIDKTHIMFI